mmetsp:Transcript_35008/g.79408  ORF Transcript_35008/g.79408 Transcript_35008/m.79408 type:complete len:295 (-) Transcript_35008:223-1107(-)
MDNVGQAACGMLAPRTAEDVRRQLVVVMHRALHAIARYRLRPVRHCRLLLPRIQLCGRCCGFPTSVKAIGVRVVRRSVVAEAADGVGGRDADGFKRFTRHEQGELVRVGVRPKHSGHCVQRLTAETRPSCRPVARATIETDREPQFPPVEASLGDCKGRLIRVRDVCAERIALQWDLHRAQRAIECPPRRVAYGRGHQPPHITKLGEYCPDGAACHCGCLAVKEGTRRACGGARSHIMGVDVLGPRQILGRPVEAGGHEHWQQRQHWVDGNLGLEEHVPLIHRARCAQQVFLVR